MDASTFQNLFDVVVQLLILILGGILIPYIKKQIGEVEYKKTLELVQIGVAAAEQIYKPLDKSDEKNTLRYQYVVDFLQKKNVKISEDEMKTLIEDAVLKLGNVIKS